MKEKKARVEDALHATRAAIEEGIVPGGGVALLRAQPALDKLKADGDETRRRRRSSAASLDDARRDHRRERRRRGRRGRQARSRTRKDDAFGFDAETEKYGDLFDAGIVDPTKVARTALQNAVSVAGLLLTHRLPGRPTSPRRRTKARRPRSRRHGRHGRDGRHGRHGWNGRHGNGHVNGAASRQMDGSTKQVRSADRIFLQNGGRPMESIHPLDDRIVVEPLEAEEKTAGGILLPDTAKEKPQKGKVSPSAPASCSKRQARRARRQEGRHRPLRQVRRQRGQGRRARNT